jgi:hypothetical protein
MGSDDHMHGVGFCLIRFFLSHRFSPLYWASISLVVISSIFLHLCMHLDARFASYRGLRRRGYAMMRGSLYSSYQLLLGEIE